MVPALLLQSIPRFPNHRVARVSVGFVVLGRLESTLGDVPHARDLLHLHGHLQLKVQ